MSGKKVLQEGDEGRGSYLKDTAMPVQLFKGKSGMVNVMRIFMSEEIMNELPRDDDG